MQGTIKVAIIVEGGIVDSVFVDGTKRDVEVRIVNHDRDSDPITSVSSIGEAEPFSQLHDDIYNLLSESFDGFLPSRHTSPPAVPCAPSAAPSGTPPPSA